MDARAPITLSISPLLISSSEPDFGWLRDKLAAAGWDERQAREVRGSLAISMRIVAPPPPAGLSGRKAAILKAGGVVWRSSGLAADVVANILIRGMHLRTGQVARLCVEKTFTLQPFGHVDITVEALV
jgi:hypothetical protein